MNTYKQKIVDDRYLFLCRDNYVLKVILIPPGGSNCWLYFPVELRLVKRLLPQMDGTKDNHRVFNLALQFFLQLNWTQSKFNEKHLLHF